MPSICTHLKHMSHVDPVHWKNRRWRESKPGIFTLRATEPSCCIYNERKIKHDRSYSLASKGSPCLIFISSQKFCSAIVSHFILFGFLLGSLNENYFKDLVQTTQYQQRTSRDRVGHEKKFHVCNISNRHHYGSTNQAQRQSSRQKRKKEKKLESDSNIRGCLPKILKLILDYIADFLETFCVIYTLVG